MKQLLSDNLRRLLRDIGLLVMRIWVGFVMLWFHGKDKVFDFAERAESFPDPLGIGSSLSLALAGGAEFFASIFIIFGLFTRVMAIPLFITLMVAAYSHAIAWQDPFGDYELALFFATAYLMFMLTGPGRLSLDHLIRKKLEN